MQPISSSQINARSGRPSFGGSFALDKSGPTTRKSLTNSTGRLSLGGRYVYTRFYVSICTTLDVSLENATNTDSVTLRFGELENV